MSVDRMHQTRCVPGRAGSVWAGPAACVWAGAELGPCRAVGAVGAPGGEAAACLRQPQLTGLFTSAQVNVSFSLSLELLSYQKLPADQMLPGVDIRQRASGEKEMVFTQNLLLEYANQTAQVSPRPAPCRRGRKRARLCSRGSEEGRPRPGLPK